MMWQKMAQKNDVVKRYTPPEYVGVDEHSTIMFGDNIQSIRHDNKT